MSSSKSIVIVGESFVTSSMPSNVQGVSQFVANLQKGDFDGAEKHGVIHLGQGVSAYDERFIREELERRHLSGQMPIRRRHSMKISRSLVHKHHEKNVLVTDLESLGPNRFRSRLCVDDDSELLLDHATGWHVPGMVILEAMRQAGMAATERFCDLSALTSNRRFVIQTWNTTFANFLFPLDAEIISTIEPVNAGKGKRLELRAEINVMQGERSSAHASIDYAVIEGDSLASLEERSARAAVRQFVQAGSPANQSESAAA